MVRTKVDSVTRIGLRPVDSWSHSSTFGRSPSFVDKKIDCHSKTYNHDKVANPFLLNLTSEISFPVATDDGPKEVRTITETFAGVPLLFNLVESCKTPSLSVDEILEFG
jgi:hypothetical protein